MSVRLLIVMQTTAFPLFLENLETWICEKARSPNLVRSCGSENSKMAGEMSKDVFC